MRHFSRKLGPRRERFLIALLANSTVADAAAEAGISAASAWRYLADPTFAAAYARARRDLVEHIATRLQNDGARCAGVLVAIAIDGRAPASARVSAARSVIELGLKAHEQQEIIARIERLENSERRLRVV